MHTILKTGAVAAALIGAIAMTTSPSEARWRHHHHGGGAAAAGFVGGLAVGAIASNAYNNSYYYGPGYGYGYYSEPGYAYYGGPTYYDSYAYAPAPRYYRYYGGGRSNSGSEALMSR
jgi:hypothetical protein